MLLQDLLDVAIIIVVLTAHAIIRKFEQPNEMGAYDRYELKLGKKTTAQTAPITKEWADMVLFANYKTFSVAVDDKGKKHKAQKAISERDSSSVSDVHGYLKLHRICASECRKWSCQQLHPSVLPHRTNSVVPETEILAGDPDYRELLEGRRIRMPDIYRIPDRY